MQLLQSRVMALPLDAAADDTIRAPSVMKPQSHRLRAWPHSEDTISNTVLILKSKRSHVMMKHDALKNNNIEISQDKKVTKACWHWCSLHLWSSRWFDSSQQEKHKCVSESWQHVQYQDLETEALNKLRDGWILFIYTCDLSTVASQNVEWKKP